MADTVDLKELASLLASLPPQIRNNQRIRKLEVMLQQARQINGKCHAVTHLLCYIHVTGGEALGA